MTRRRRIAGWLIFIMVALAAWAAALYFLLGDEPPPADGDLRSFRRVVAEDGNGFPLLDFPSEEVFWPEEPDDLTRIDDELDRDLAVEVVARNEEVLRRVDDSLARPDFQIPQPEGPESIVGYLVTWRAMTYALSVRCRLRLQEGRDGEALEDALRLVRLGHRIQGGQSAQIDYLVGIAVHSIGSQLLLHLAPRARPGRAEIQDAIARCAAFMPDPRSLGDAYRVEYAMFSRVFDRLAVGEDSGLEEELAGKRWVFRTPLFRPNRTKRLFSEDLRLLIADAAKPAVERSLPDVEAKYDLEAKTTLLNLGDIILGKLVPVYTDSLAQQDAAATYLAAARVMLALRLYHDDFLELPASLADLVPEYLDAVPADPIDAQPLRYSRERRILYSIGSDHVDAGGSGKEGVEAARADSAEPTFRIEIE